MGRLLIALLLSLSVLMVSILWATPIRAETAQARIRAETAQDRIVAALNREGYTVLQQERTFLGRMWLLVENDTLRREIVFNPGTGEILRDYSVLLAGTDAAARKARDLAGNAGAFPAAPLENGNTRPIRPALPDPISPAPISPNPAD